MGIVRGRPLFFTALCVSALAVLFLYFREVPVFIAAGLASCLFPVFMIPLLVRRRLSPYRFFSAVICSLILTLFSVRCGFFYLSASKAAANASEDGAVLFGRVLEVRYSTTYSFGCYAELSGDSSGSDSVRAFVEFQFPASLRKNDRFSISGFEIDSGGTDAELLADGIFMTVSVPDSFSLVSVKNRSGGRSAEDIKKRLSVLLAEKVGGEEGGLCAAMLLGDRSGLGELLKRDFRRSGVSHILAVSGMHVSALTGSAGAVLSAAGIRKRLRLLLLSALAIAYLWVLGFPVSAVRSVIMILAVFAGGFTGSGSDGINSLGLAVCVIVAVSPLSVCDVSFVFTVLSTLGILSYGVLKRGKTGTEKSGDITCAEGRRSRERISRGAGKTVAAWMGKVGDGLAVWTAANMLTLMPLSLSFGVFSLMSPVSSLIFGLPAVFLLNASALTLVFSVSDYLSGFFGYWGKLSARQLISLSERISSMRGVEVSLGFGWVPFILLPMTAATAVLLCIRLKKKYRFVCFLPFLLSVVLFGALYIREIKSCEAPRASFLTGNGNDTFVVCGGCTAVVGDAGSGSYSLLYEAEKTARRFGAAETEVFILTHCHLRHLSSVRKYLSRNMVRQVWIPEPSDRDSASVVIGLAKLCEEFGCECVIYRPGADLTVFSDCSAVFSGELGLPRSTHPVFWFSLSRKGGKEKIIYLGRSVWESDYFGVAKEAPGSHIIAGSHGPVAKPFVGRTPGGERYSYYPAYASSGLALSDPGLLRYFVPPGGRALELTLNLPVVVYEERIDLFLPP